MRVVVFFITLWICLVFTRSAPGGEDAFNNEVRPILAKHCFKCHGPDDKARKAKLRLDQREPALHGGKSKRPAIVPGHPERS